MPGSSLRSHGEGMAGHHHPEFATAGWGPRLFVLQGIGLEMFTVRWRLWDQPLSLGMWNRMVVRVSLQQPGLLGIWRPGGAHSVATRGRPRMADLGARAVAALVFLALFFDHAVANQGGAPGHSFQGALPSPYGDAWGQSPAGQFQNQFSDPSGSVPGQYAQPKRYPPTGPYAAAPLGPNYRRPERVQSQGLFARWKNTLFSAVSGDEPNYDGQRPYRHPTAPSYGQPSRPPPGSRYEGVEDAGLVGKLKSMFGDEEMATVEQSYASPVSQGQNLQPPVYHEQSAYDRSQYPLRNHNHPIAQSNVDSRGSQIGAYDQPQLHPRPATSMGWSQSPQTTLHHPSYPSQPLVGRQEWVASHPPSFTEPVAPVPPTQTLAPPSPQATIHEDGIVFVLHPAHLARKRLAMQQAGPQALQVFADFEHVFTKFNLMDGSRAMSTSELLESSGAVAPEAIAQLQAIADEASHGGKVASVEEDEDVALRSLEAIARSGRVRIGAVAPATRAFMNMLGLRDQARELLNSLCQRSVPTFVFSPGYGDVVTQALLHLTSDSHGLAPAAALPANLRVISNFFRAGPDGMVRAFSQPLIHDSNKNASTASKFMGMPLPPRPFAIVLAAHEDDVSMTVGMEGLQDQITVGLLDVTDDLPQRLPVFLRAFDVVLVGDCGLGFVRSLLEDVLQLPRGGQSSPTTLNKLSSLRKGLGALLGAQVEQQPSLSHSQPHSQPPPSHQEYSPSPGPPPAYFPPQGFDYGDASF